MMKTCILALLLAIAMSQTVNLVISSPSTTTISIPAGMTVTNEFLHNWIGPNVLGNGANWIWNNIADGWPDGYTNTFQTLFPANCISTKALLRATADNEFTAYINGVLVLSGNNWKNIYNASIALKCGINNLTIRVVNRHSGTPAALVFSVTQDQTSCFKCLHPQGYYNSTTCNCSCYGNCNCSALNRAWAWYGYPNCVCACPGLPVSCAHPKIWNGYTCKCECPKKTCPKGYTLSALTCECIGSICPTSGTCPTLKKWDIKYCGCGCQSYKECADGEDWIDKTCSCGKIV